MTCDEFRTDLSLVETLRSQAERMHQRIGTLGANPALVRGSIEEITFRNALQMEKEAQECLGPLRASPEFRPIEMRCQRSFRRGLSVETFDLLIAEVFDETGIDFLGRPLSEFASAIRRTQTPSLNDRPGHSQEVVELVDDRSRNGDPLIRFWTAFRTNIRREWAKARLEDLSKEVNHLLNPIWVIHATWSNITKGERDENDLTMMSIGYLDLFNNYRKLEAILEKPGVRTGLMLEHEKAVEVAGAAYGSYSEAGHQLLLEHWNLFGKEHFDAAGRWRNGSGGPLPTIGTQELEQFSQSMRLFPQLNFSAESVNEANVKPSERDLPASAPTQGPIHGADAEPELVTVKELASHRSRGSVDALRKFLLRQGLKHVNPGARSTGGGKTAFLWDYQKILPVLREHFPNEQWPDSMNGLRRRNR